MIDVDYESFVACPADPSLRVHLTSDLCLSTCVCLTKPFVSCVQVVSLFSDILEDYCDHTAPERLNFEALKPVVVATIATQVKAAKNMKAVSALKDMQRECICL